jgi:serine/threonine protein kinase
MDLLRKQLSQSLEKGVTVLGKEGACGALFQITLLQFGYTFIAKGVTSGRLPELEREVAIYEKLQPLQGHHIPVYLGSVDLKSLGQVFFYDIDVRIIHFILLSYAGTEVKAVAGNSKTHIIDTVTSILEKIHSLGVAHRDVRLPNVLQSPGGEINLIDFDRAVFLPAAARSTLSAISPNKRRRLIKGGGHETSLPTKQDVLLLSKIRQDNSNAQSLFSLDSGRIIGRVPVGPNWQPTPIRRARRVDPRQQLSG